MTSNNNLVLWDSMRQVERKFTKSITGKSYKGDSPNPTYVIRKLTEALGPIGKQWGFRVISEHVRYGKPHQVVTEETVVMQDTPDADGNPRAKSKTKRYEIIREEYHQINIRFWFIHKDDPEQRERHYDAIGGTPMLYVTKRGDWMHDEDAAKKSLTDAYTKGASWLGACADIFLGLFDDKYSGEPDNSEAQRSESNQQYDGSKGDTEPKQPDQQRSNSAPDGW